MQENNSINPVIFKFQSNQVRITMIEGEPWFALTDICQVLKIGNPSKVKTRLSQDQSHALTSSDTVGRRNIIIFVSESGLYEVILGSRTTEKTEAFKKWVTNDVLPSIRKTGQYQIPTQPTLPTPSIHRVMAVTPLEYQRQQLMSSILQSFNKYDITMLPFEQRLKMMDRLERAIPTQLLCPETGEETTVLMVR